MKKEASNICAWCGERYQCCAQSRMLNSWRVNFCSPDCFANYLDACKQRKLDSCADANANVRQLVSDAPLPAEPPAGKKPKKNKRKE